jgi:hypothetical protein
MEMPCLKGKRFSTFSTFFDTFSLTPFPLMFLTKEMPAGLMGTWITNPA